MNCTINTDASFLPIQKRGGWSAWIKCDMYTIKEYGEFKDYVVNVQQAECAAVCNAIHMVLRRGIEFENIYINCDNKTVVDAINNRKSSDKVPASKTLIELLNKFDCQIEARHVKAHTHTNTKRHFVNDWCDRNSRNYIRNLKIQKSAL